MPSFNPTSAFATLVILWILQLTLTFIYIYQPINNHASSRRIAPSRNDDNGAYKKMEERLSVALKELNALRKISETAGKNGSDDGRRSGPRDYIAELTELTDGHITNITCPKPLVPVYNHIASQANLESNNDRNIPKILHFSMKSRCLPPDLLQRIERWKEILPNYSIFFHSDTAVDKLIYNNLWEEFPELHKVMSCVFPGAMTIDVWRLLVLYKYGGIYSDIDLWPEEEFNEDYIGNDLSFFSFSDGYYRPSQWFLASEPRLPMMYLAMRIIIENIKNVPHLQVIKVTHVTGPHAFLNAYDIFFQNVKDRNIHGKPGGIYVGMAGIVGRRLGRYDSKMTITNKKYYDDIVTSRLNPKQQMTREERIAEESGVVHWQKALRQGRKDRKGLMGSCKQVMESAESRKNTASSF